MDNPTVDTIDLYTMPTDKARRLSKRNKCPFSYRLLLLPGDLQVPVLPALGYVSLTGSRHRTLYPTYTLLSTLRMPDQFPTDLFECSVFPTALFYGGLCLLPWLWFANIWLFWPEFRHGPDPEVKKCATPNQQPHSPPLPPFPVFALLLY